MSMHKCFKHRNIIIHLCVVTLRHYSKRYQKIHQNKLTHLCIAVANGLGNSSSHQLLPPVMKLGQGNFFRSVHQEFCPQWGVFASVHAETHPSGSRHLPPLRSRHTRGSRPPRKQTLLEADTPGKQTLHMTLKFWCRPMKKVLSSYSDLAP